MSAAERIAAFRIAAGRKTTWCCEVQATYHETPADVPLPIQGVTVSIGAKRTDVSIPRLRVQAITPEVAHHQAITTLLDRVERAGFLERPRRPVRLSCDAQRGDVT